MNDTTGSKIAEVEELLSFAEKVSEQISRLESQYQKLKFTFMMCVMGAYLAITAILLIFMKNEFPENAKIISLATLVLLLVGLVFLTVSRNNLMRGVRRSLSVEFKVLENLIQMLTSLLESVPADAPIVIKGLLEMRMMRIKFSNQEIERMLREQHLDRRERNAQSSGGR